MQVKCPDNIMYILLLFTSMLLTEKMLKCYWLSKTKEYRVEGNMSFSMNPLESSSFVDNVFRTVDCNQCSCSSQTLMIFLPVPFRWDRILSNSWRWEIQCQSKGRIDLARLWGSSLVSFTGPLSKALNSFIFLSDTLSRVKTRPPRELDSCQGPPSRV